MTTPQKLAEKMAEKTDQQLLDMFPKANEWTPEALDAARAELQKRNLPIPLAAPPPPNLDYEITASGRKRLLRATTLDILISIFLPGWGVIVGLMAWFKDERKRAVTMIVIGLISIGIVIYQRVHLGFRDAPDTNGAVLIPDRMR